MSIFADLMSLSEGQSLYADLRSPSDRSINIPASAPGVADVAEEANVDGNKSI